MSKHSSFLPILAASVILSCHPVKAEDPSKVPFKLHRGSHIVVKGSVAGLQKLNLLIDTGAGVTTVDQRIVKKLKLETSSVDAASLFGPSQMVKEAVLKSLGFGPFQVGAVDALVLDLAQVDFGTRIDAIVGLDVLRQFNFTIDYQSKRLLLRDRRPLQSTVKLTSAVPLLSVTLSVSGYPLRMMLDTGADNSVVFRSAENSGLLPMSMLGVETIRHVQGTSYATQVRLPDVNLGSSAWRSLPAILVSSPAPEGLQIDGILAVTSLGAKRIHFDFEYDLVSWEE